MARAPIATILGGARKKFEEQKHRRGAGGKFASKGVTKPGPKTKSGTKSAKDTVYELADKMPGKSKKEVLKAAADAGVNPSTAANHYFYWQKSKATVAAIKSPAVNTPEKLVQQGKDPLDELKKAVGQQMGLKAPKKSAKDTVYGLADEMRGKSKKDVVHAAVAKGVHPSTAANHYHFWSKGKKAEPKKAPEPKPEPEPEPEPKPKPEPKPEPKPDPKPAPKPEPTKKVDSPEVANVKKLLAKHEATAKDPAVTGGAKIKAQNNVKYYQSKLKKLENGGVAPKTDALLGKPVSSMSDAELKSAVEILKGVQTKPAIPGQHKFEDWHEVNGSHYTKGEVGVSYMKPVRDKAGVTYNHSNYAVQSYTGSGYGNINGGLRGTDVLTSSSVTKIRELDKLIAKSTFKEETVMWRGVGSGGTVFNGAPPPEDLTDSSFASVSFSSSVAKRFSDGKTVFRVKVPKGFPGLNIAIGSPKTSDEGLAGEAEVLLPRGTTYRVVARHKGKGPRYNKYNYATGKTSTTDMDVVDLEPVLPPGYPNYD